MSDQRDAQVAQAEELDALFRSEWPWMTTAQNEALKAGASALRVLASPQEDAPHVGDDPITDAIAGVLGGLDTIRAEAESIPQVGGPEATILEQLDDVDAAFAIVAAAVSRPSVSPEQELFIPHGSTCEADHDNSDYGKCGEPARAVVQHDGRDRYVCADHKARHKSSEGSPSPAEAQGWQAVVDQALNALESPATPKQRRAAWYALREHFYPVFADAPPPEAQQ